MEGADPIAEAIGAIVSEGALAGAVTAVWHAERGIHRVCAGWRDREARLPMQRDTLFRIASLTKPITSVAALMLLEEGRFALEDPIARWAPQFASPRVLRDPEGDLDRTEPALRPIRFGDLLTHRAGLTYGAIFQPGPIGLAYDAALGGDVDTELDPDVWIERLAALPLIDQPGAAFHYSHATDLLGLLIARIEDRPLGEVLQRRIFGPLGMIDTGFTVPREKRERRAALYGFDAEGRLVRRSTVSAGATLPERPEHFRYVSGGQGLWSTADDYLRFARIFLGEGSVDGARILRPETLARMTADQLTAEQRASVRMAGLPLFAGHGFGLGVGVMRDPARAFTSLCGGGVGSVGWPGLWGGWWQADARAQGAAVFLTHNVVEPEQNARGLGLGAFQAARRIAALLDAREA
jgi:CubicO group peptidase (beta-lactamase class C family)